MDIGGHVVKVTEDVKLLTYVTGEDTEEEGTIPLT